MERGPQFRALLHFAGQALFRHFYEPNEVVEVLEASGRGSNNLVWQNIMEVA